MSNISSRLFFTVNGHPVTLYTLRNDAGMEVEISELGGCIVALRVPDRNGKLADVVLGYDSYEGYRSRKYFLGATIGRSANRIAGGHFSINATQYQLACNEQSVTHIHGGNAGFDQALFTGTPLETADGAAAALRYVSYDGEEGYPGRLLLTVTFTLTEQNELCIHYHATSDKDTLCNLTNHSYFNLAGHDKGTILGHQLCIHASCFTEADERSIPTGRMLPVEGTPMDFRNFHAVGDRIEQAFVPLLNARGYDHHFPLDQPADGTLRPAAALWHPESGRYMECLTTCPGLQLYTGNYIDGTQAGKDDAVYRQRAGLCLETQFAPDAIHHPEWEQPVLRAGEVYDQTTVFRFSVKND